jgi:hypothetical protein
MIALLKIKNIQMKLRAFKSDVFWSECIFLFDLNIKFNDIKNNIKTSFLTKNDYIGEFEYDEKFLKLFGKNKINEYDYYFIYYFKK